MTENLTRKDDKEWFTQIVRKQVKKSALERVKRLRKRFIRSKKNTLM